MREVPGKGKIRLDVQVLGADGAESYAAETGKASGRVDGLAVVRDGLRRAFGHAQTAAGAGVGGQGMELAAGTFAAIGEGSLDVQGNRP